MAASTSRTAILCFMIASFSTVLCQNLRQNVEIPSSGAEPALPAVLVRPDGTGPFPAMVILHGVGGMWSSAVTGQMISNFEEWVTIFQARGIVSIFPDSYTPRGFADFRNRRPAENSSIDDAPVSPAYVRPKDAFRALNYLRALSYVRSDAIGIMGFSHGGETALSSVLYSSISKNPWKLSYLYNNGTTDYNYAVPAPPRPDPIEAGGFNVCVAWYPGCGFYGYYGSLSAAAGTQPNHYMPYTHTLMMHGTIDPLYTSGYPWLLTQKAQSHADSLGLSYNPLFNVSYEGAAHSFDQVTSASGDQPETPDQTAKRLAREAALAWLDTYLLAPLAIQSPSATGSAPSDPGANTAPSSSEQSPMSDSAPSSGAPASTTQSPSQGGADSAPATAVSPGTLVPTGEESILAPASSASSSKPLIVVGLVAVTASLLAIILSVAAI